MKRLFTLVLSIALLTVLTATAFAASYGPTNNTPEVTVTYSVAPTFTVTIPASVNLGESIDISVDNVCVKFGDAVFVKLTATSKNNAFELKTDEGATLPYTIKNGNNEVKIGDVVLAVEPATAASSRTAKLNFSADTKATYAGTYKGTVTFTIEVGSYRS